LLYQITYGVIAGMRGWRVLAARSPSPRGLSMLVFFDVVFVTLALWTFERWS
jgi:hypothetical protein